MKNLLKINLFLFTYSSKKLIFVFILLLILPLTGCKSVVKETDVEKPVRIVSPNGDVYVGEVMSGKPHGQGTRTFTNGTSMLVNGRMEKKMEMGKGIHLMEEIMLGNGRMVKNTVKELSLILMGKSMLGNGRKVEKMVKEQTFSLMEVKGLESSEKVDLGISLTEIKTETS